MSHKAYTKPFIREALLQLMKEKPYAEITVSEICEKAGVGRATFYRNFKEKDSVLEEMIVSATEEFRKKTYSSFLGSDEMGFVDALFEHMFEYRELADLFYRADKLDLVLKELEKAFLLLDKEGQEHYHYLFIAGGFYNVFAHWVANGCRESVPELREKLLPITK